MEKVEFWLRLSAVRGISSKVLIRKAEKLCAAGEITDELLVQSGFDDLQRQQFWQLAPHKIEQVNCWLDNKQHHLISALDTHYPLALREIARFPLLLYVAGDPALLSSPQLAVVGSRHASHYGRQWGEYFTRALARCGLTITSGLARGIDGVAHRAALDADGKTIAVLGSGLAQLYPRQHRQLARAIVEQGGTIVSEFPLLTTPHATNFPRRNRIISGLSQGVLVVEASLKSGSLVTARYALEQNRNVYALPGALGNSGSEGGHWLIQQGAMLVMHPDNILEDLRSDLNWLPFTPSEAIYSPDSDDVPLPFADVLANVGDEVTPVDVVAERAGQPVPVISAQLLELELAGWIAAVPGGYVRLRRACHVRRTYVLV